MAQVKFGNVKDEAWSLVRAHRRPLLIGFGLMVISRLAAFVLPASTKYLIDDVLNGGNRGMLLPLVALGLGATILQAAAGFLLAKVVSIAAQRAIADMRVSVQDHVLRLPTSYFDSTKTGVLISRIMTDPEGIRNLVGTGIIQLVGGIFTATIALVWLFTIHATMTAGTLVLLGIFGGVMAIAFKKLRPIFRKRGEINAEVTGRLTETLGGVRLVKVYTAEERERGVFQEGALRLFRNIASSITGTSLLGSLSVVIVGAVSVWIMLIGGRGVLNGDISLGDLLSYVFLVGMMVAPLVNIASIGTQITEAFAGLDRMREIRAVETEDANEANKQRLESVDGNVEFREVTFSYKEGVPVLEGISFVAPAGTTTALVGPSGAGKSSLIGLIMAFHLPDSGTILVDGRDVSELRVHDYRRQLGVVMQDNFLFDGSVRDNIAFSRPDASDTDIEGGGARRECG